MPRKNLDETSRESWASEGVIRVTRCSSCPAGFGMSSAATFGIFGMWRRHHSSICRNSVRWSRCSNWIRCTPLTRRDEVEYAEKVKRVCDDCFIRARAAQEEAAKLEVAVQESRIVDPRNSAERSSTLEKLAGLHDQVYREFDCALGEAVVLQVLHEQREADWRSLMHRGAASAPLHAFGADE